MKNPGDLFYSKVRQKGISKNPYHKITILAKTERFNKIENEITLVRQEIRDFRKDTKAEIKGLDDKIDILRKDTKVEIDSLRKEIKADIKELDNKIDILRKDQEAGFATLAAKISAEITKSKNDTLKWVIGLVAVQLTSILAICLAKQIFRFPGFVIMKN